MANIYTQEDWSRDGLLRVQPGQYIDDEVFYQLRDVVPPTTLRYGIFQPGEADSMSQDFQDLFMTFVREGDMWKYIGLCPKGTTNVTPKYNFEKVSINENDIKNMVQESVKRILKEVYNTVQWQNFDNKDLDNKYYNGFVIVDGTRAVLGQYDNYDEAVEDAREMARRNKFGTYEVYGCDENGYALEEDYPEDNTLVYSTDEEMLNENNSMDIINKVVDYIVQTDGENIDEFTTMGEVKNIIQDAYINVVGTELTDRDIFRQIIITLKNKL